MNEWGVVLALTTMVGLFGTTLGIGYNYLVKPSKEDKKELASEYKGLSNQFAELTIEFTKLNTNLANMIETDRKQNETLLEHARDINNLLADNQIIKMEIGYIKDRK